MKEARHPHPHIDPRQPRNGARPRQNPPVFAWKPACDGCTFSLKVARNQDLSDPVIGREGLVEPAFLPDEALEPGRYFWNWSDGESEGEVFTFEMTPDAVTLEVPSVGEWLRRFPEGHPCLYVRSEDVSALRESRNSERKKDWRALQEVADGLLEQPHEYPEPPFLPDRQRDYKAYYDVWSKVLREARQFVQGASMLALAYLASGEKKYGRAACRRMASVSTWDPEGSSHIPHNDEAHMSIVWWGPSACDWAWDAFTDAERELVINQFRERGRITYEFMHDRGSYGVTRFDSHAGREIVFLALIAFVFREHIPEAQKWLEWLRPVLCAIWPIWAEDDGGWAEGPLYGLAYVDIMTMFATALKRGAGVDLYRRPFWKNHAQWRRWCWPPYAEWLGFGDCGLRAPGTWHGNANLVEKIERETGSAASSDYVKALRKEAGRVKGHRKYDIWLADPQRYLSPARGIPKEEQPGNGKVLRVFPGAGWAAIRTDFDSPKSDIAFIFRSSPLGAVSHSHANNNDFIIHVAGRCLAMPSGYYTGYGSGHHANWNWHTKSHNCVTLSDAGQLMRSHDSLGRTENAFEDDRLAYMCGNADASYQDRAERCRRHVVFLKSHKCFVLIDEFVAKEGVASALQWNIHSWNNFKVDERKRTFALERGKSALKGHFMYHHNSFFTVWKGWDPPPMQTHGRSKYPIQYNLRFTTDGFAATRNLGVVLCPSHAGLKPPVVMAEREGDVEVARVGGDLVLVRQGGNIEHGNIKSDALAVLVIGGRRYDIDDGGIRAV